MVAAIYSGDHHTLLTLCHRHTCAHFIGPWHNSAKGGATHHILNPTHRRHAGYVINVWRDELWDVCVEEWMRKERGSYRMCVWRNG